MYNKNSIFDYYDSNSIIHRLNPVYKIISILFLLLYIFLSSSIIDYIILSFLIFIVVSFSDISIRVYLSDIKYFYIVMIFLFVIGMFKFNLIVGIIFVIKFIYLYLYMSTMTMSSSFNSIVYGFERILKPLHKIIDVSYLALRIGLIIKFISIMYNESIRIRNSRMLRGVIFSDMKFIDRVNNGIYNIVPVFNSSIDKIKKIENVMRVRNYGVYDVRNNYRLNKFGKTDTILLGINMVILIIIFIY